MIRPSIPNAYEIVFDRPGDTSYKLATRDGERRESLEGTAFSSRSAVRRCDYNRPLVIQRRPATGRRFMIAQLQLGPSAEESRQVLDQVVLPLRPKDRLAAWLTRAAVSYGDGDQGTYEQLLLYRGMLLMSPGLDIQPYIDAMAERLGESAAADAADGLDMDDEALVSRWQETNAECAASPVSVDAYLGCAKGEALAQLLWQRGFCPASAGEFRRNREI